MDDFQQNPEYGLIECVFDTISAESAVFWLGLRGLPPQSRVRIERYMIHVQKQPVYTCSIQRTTGNTVACQ